MSGIEKRVDKLEQESGGSVPSFTYVSWESDGSIPDDAILKLDNGLLMTYSEYVKRYGEPEPVLITWEEDDDISLE